MFGLNLDLQPYNLTVVRKHIHKRCATDHGKHISSQIFVNAGLKLCYMGDVLKTDVFEEDPEQLY